MRSILLRPVFVREAWSRTTFRPQRFSEWGWLVLLAIAMTMSSGARAQMAGAGAISGTVTDSMGAVVAGAKVTAASVDTNAATIRISTGTGDYNITPLVPGEYTLTVTAKGFEKSVQEHVSVNALTTATVNIKLAVGAASETVTVTTAPPMLETDDAAMGQVMDNDMYSSLPLLMGQGANNDQRRATDFAYLMPGVQNTYAMNSGSTPTVSTGSVNGGNPAGGTSDVYIDGIDLPQADIVGDPRFTWTAFSVDAIDQFQVQTSGFSTQYGGQGIQNYSIKHGTNQIHGSIYSYTRNTVLDAWKPNAKTPTPVAGAAIPAGASCSSTALSASTSWCKLGGIKPHEIQNEVGLNIAGPIIKNKLFVFYNYGQYRNQNGPSPKVQTLPTLAMMGYATNGSALGYADFSGVTGWTIYDPNTQNVANCNGSGCKRTAFANNHVPASRISAASAYINKFMLPLESGVNQTAYSNNIVAGQPSGLSNWYQSGRIDYNPNDQHQISLIIGFGRQSNTGANSSGLLPPPFNASQSYAPQTNIDIIKDVWTINLHLVNVASVGYGRYKSLSISPNDGPEYAASETGLLNTPAGQASFFPAVAFSGGPTNSSPTTYGGYDENQKVNNTYSATDNLQWLHGKHSITVGAQAVEVQYNYISNETYSSPLTYTFSGTQTVGYSATGSSLANTGLPFASFMLGAVGSSTVSVGIPGLGSRWLDPSSWVQDDYRITPRLTVNAGLRWDIWPAIHEVHDLITWLDPTTQNPLTGNLGTLAFAGGSTSDGFHTGEHVPSGIWYKNLAPRLGLAYSVDSKTVVRASYGLNFARGDWTSGNATGSPSTVGLAPAASALAGLANAPSFYWDGTACSGAAGGTGTLAGDGITPCGWTGSVAQPSSVVPSGYTLADFGTTETATLKNANSQTARYWDPYLGSRTPEYLNWTFGIERQINNNMSVSVSYVGSEGHFISVSNAIGSRNNKLPESMAALAGYNYATSTSAANTATPCSGASCVNVLLGMKGTTTTTTSYLTEAQSLGFNPPNPFGNPANYYYTGNTVASYYGNFPQFSGVSDATSFVGNENWNALEVSVRQRASHGLTWTLNYTYSKNIDDLGTFRVYDNNRLDRSLSSADQPQNLSIRAVYNLPFGRGHMFGDNWLYKTIASDWALSGIGTIHSGLPVLVTASGCGGSSILGTCMPSIVPGQQGRQYTYGKTAAGTKVNWDPNSANYIGNVQYINPLAFVVNVVGTTGPTGNYGTYNGQATESLGGEAYSVGPGPGLYVPGNAPRVAPLNAFGQRTVNADIALKRAFPTYREWKVQFELDMSNVANHVVYNAPASTMVQSGVTNGVVNPGFASIASVANSPREVQAAVRISF